MYSSSLVNFVEKNYTTIEIEALTMVYALHKFRHYMLNNMFTFYVEHMALVYLVNKPYVATLALGSRPRQRGCKGAGQEEARESHHILPGV
jgi:hypothetical protein